MNEHTETRYCRSCFTEHPVRYVGGFPLVICPNIPKGELRLRGPHTEKEVGRIINIGEARRESGMTKTYPEEIARLAQWLRILRTWQDHFEPETDIHQLYWEVCGHIEVLLSLLRDEEKKKHEEVG